MTLLLLPLLIGAQSNSYPSTTDPKAAATRTSFRSRRVGASAVPSHSPRFYAIRKVLNDFVLDVHEADSVRAQFPMPAVHLLDVGANSGTFSQQMMRRLRKYAGHTLVDLTMFEPQPRLFRKLSALAMSWNGTLVAAAAWKANTNLTFYLHANNSELATANVANKALQYDAAGFRPDLRLMVPAVDIAEYLLRRLPQSNNSLVFLKLDIEGSEYDVLPWLLKKRALCRLSFLLIEWHLNFVASSRRATGLALKKGLQSELHRSCKPGLPPVVVHDNMPSNNELDWKKGNWAAAGAMEEATAENVAADYLLAARRRHRWAASKEAAKR